MQARARGRPTRRAPPLRLPRLDLVALALLEVALHLLVAHAARRVDAPGCALQQQHQLEGRQQLEPAALDALAALGLLRGRGGAGVSEAWGWCWLGMRGEDDTMAGA